MSCLFAAFSKTIERTLMISVVLLWLRLVWSDYEFCFAIIESIFIDVNSQRLIKMLGSISTFDQRLVKSSWKRWYFAVHVQHTHALRQSIQITVVTDVQSFSCVIHPKNVVFWTIEVHRNSHTSRNTHSVLNLQQIYESARVGWYRHFTTKHLEYEPFCQIWSWTTDIICHG